LEWLASGEDLQGGRLHNCKSSRWTRWH